MNRRIGRVGAIAALALTLLIPGTTSAAYNPFRAEVLRAACTSTGGEFDFGKVVLKIEAISYNSADDDWGTNYFIFNSRRQEKIDGSWVTVDQTIVQSPVYPDFYGDLFSAVNRMKYSFPSSDHPRTRIVMRVAFWDQHESGDVRLATLGFRTEGC